MYMLNLPCPQVTQAELDAWPEARERLKAGENVAEAITLRNRLLVSVYPLVFQVISRYSTARPHIPFANFWEAAVNGMYNAVNSYNPTLGTWQHWAKLHARQQMQRVTSADELLILDAPSQREPRETRLNRFIGSCPSTEDSITFGWVDKGLASLDGAEYELIVKCVIDGEELSSIAWRHGKSREWARLKKNRALDKMRLAHDEQERIIELI